jgi:hypothetical protein
MTTERTPNQAALWEQVDHWQPYHHLAELPDEICEALVPIAQANKGGGWWMIQASAKLNKLSKMTHPEIIAAFEQNKAQFELGAAPNGVKI